MAQPFPETAPPEVLVLTSEKFGARVGERLRVSVGAAVQAVGPDGTHPSLWPHADVIVVASGYERSSLFKAVDRTAFAWRRPWLPVYATATAVYCGPVVRPGDTACYLCFVARREQHRVPVQSGTPVAYEVEVAHPVHHVGIAAALARQAIGEALSGPPADSLGATVRTFDQISGGTAASSVVAVDRCERCRTADPVAEEEALWRAVAAEAAGPALSGGSQQEVARR